MVSRRAGPVSAPRRPLAVAAGRTKSLGVDNGPDNGKLWLRRSAGKVKEVLGIAGGISSRRDPLASARVEVVRRNANILL